MTPKNKNKQNMSTNTGLLKNRYFGVYLGLSRASKELLEHQFRK